MIYSLIGWVYESIYCTVKSGKWENRGFLYGPACPIYGTGAVAISILITLTAGADVSFEPWQIFLISVAGSAVLEYITSWALEKTFHALWWDYSYLPFNLNGRISLFTSLGFGGAGLIIVYYLAPATETLMSILSPLATEILALLLVVAFTVDMTLTVTALLLTTAYFNTCYYPSNADLQSSLTMPGSCSSEFTLRTMFYVSLLIPFVLAYIIYAWRSIDRKNSQ